MSCFDRFLVVESERRQGAPESSGLPPQKWGNGNGEPCDFAAGLVLPEPTVNLEGETTVRGGPTDTSPSGESLVIATGLSVSLGIDKGAQNRSALALIAQVAKAVFTSNNFYASVGNCLLTSSLWTGLIHPLCATLAIINEMAESRRKNRASTPESNYTPGLLQDSLDLYRSPGFYRFVLGIAFIFNLMESVPLGQVIYSVALGLAALANLGASSILNSEYFEALDSSRGVTRQRDERPSIQLITSPGIIWSACDVLFGFSNLPQISLLSCAGISAYVAGGAATAAFLSPLWLGDRAAKSHIPLLLNAATNLGFGLAQISSGSPTLGMAFFAWAIASSIMALAQREIATKRR